MSKSNINTVNQSCMSNSTQNYYKIRSFIGTVTMTVPITQNKDYHMLTNIIYVGNLTSD